MWGELKHKLFASVRVREHLLSFIPVPVPDPHVFRALIFVVNPLYGGLTFDFNLDSGSLFNITIGIGSDRE